MTCQNNILSIQDNARGETTNYAYDDLDRLLSASVTTGGNQYNRSWTYDALGNMQTRVENGAPTNYSYDPNHKHAVASAGGAAYQYDANGNMTNRNVIHSKVTWTRYLQTARRIILPKWGPCHSRCFD
ncbi:MAG: hypothetical protein EYC68_03910 [Chloroflexota bacterium]|nr:MAG: hypothetical protein EYC68_03910 [Chloroflexota bacterium]